MDYRKVIVSAMEKNNITYEALADKLGMTRQALWLTVNGKRSNNPVSPTGSKSIRLDRLEDILDVLGLKLAVVEKNV